MNIIIVIIKVKLKYVSLKKKNCENELYLG